ncbi:putative carboxylesterase 12 [Dorcoceras hygrometricum]|uniref:Putative carboxylesterase 12 n=1 Tax=Dorcoceras hygrometricum TaxID=472368 RepID=A0A2Z6ZVI6_9LAMI|nr:putative carboxylesterase 12 [Dorcoceras hygrometricum]
MRPLLHTAASIVRHGGAASHRPRKLLRVERRESPPPSPMVAHRVAPLPATLVEGWPMRRWDAAARDGRSSCTWMRDVALRFVRWCAAAATSFRWWRHRRRRPPLRRCSGDVVTAGLNSSRVWFEPVPGSP